MVWKRGKTSLNTRASTWWAPGPAVGRGRALVEDERLGPLAAADRLLEDITLAPALEHLLLEGGEGLRGIDRAVRRGHRPRLFAGSLEHERARAALTSCADRGLHSQGLGAPQQRAAVPAEADAHADVAPARRAEAWGAASRSPRSTGRPRRLRRVGPDPPGEVRMVVRGITHTSSRCRKRLSAGALRQPDVYTGPPGLASRFRRGLRTRSTRARCAPGTTSRPEPPRPG